MLSPNWLGEYENKADHSIQSEVALHEVEGAWS